MQPKPSSLRAQAHQSKSRTETCELVKVEQKLLDIRAERKENAREVGTNNKITCVEVYFQRTIDKYSACVEVGKPIDENPACVEVGKPIEKSRL
ncbi:hypothetical protein TNCV_361981 [Trichonephila clavipes]|nr:hypothetical protein TNCV_361981 [Trichonephila clavipes]